MPPIPYHHSYSLENRIYFSSKCFLLLFSIRAFFCGRWQLTGQERKEGDLFLFYSFPLAHEHSGIYMQLCPWDDCHIFLIAMLVFTRPLLDKIYYRLIELLFDWLMMWYLFKFVCLLIWFKVLLQLFDMRETGGLELASTITLVLQANRLTNLFIYLRIFIQAVCTSYLSSWINNSPIHKYIHIYTLQ